tara:strand:+ start:950 stop:1228 length:279 start_codon:yes stop_codon:yes gene_type:complete
MRANDQWYYIKTQENTSKFDIGDLIYDPRDESIGLIICINDDCKDTNDFAYKCFDTVAGGVFWFSMADIDKNCELLEKVKKTLDKFSKRDKI